jgi:SAM-dependent methyltransferase
MTSACPVCCSSLTRLHLDGEESAFDPAILGSSRVKIAHGRILRCAACGFGFRETRSTPDELADFYRRMDIDVYESEIENRGVTARRHVAILQRFTGTNTGRLLDAGCASGLFLREARRAGWSVEGVEPSETLHAMAVQTLGETTPLHRAILEHADLTPASFDAVTLWDVLEHVPEPVAFLNLCAKLLRPGGKLFVNVPDLDSPEARILGRKWPLLLAEHLNYFNRRSLSVCAENAGLRRIHFGRRQASFSLDYILFRLSQHRIPATNLLRRIADPAFGNLRVPIYLGETLSVWSR